MNRITRAVIPLAGRGTRMFPASRVVPKGLMPLIDRDGMAKAAIQILVEECIASGIEQVALVVSPGTDDAYRNYFSPLQPGEQLALAGNPRAMEQAACLVNLAERVSYFVQEEPLGFGHAVWCARSFIEGGPFVVMLGDHAYSSFSNTPCLRQTLDAAGEGSVFAVHAVDESVVGRFGIVQGEPVGPSLWRVNRIAEKPTVELARAELMTSGKCLAHFGIYVFGAAIMPILDRMVAATRGEEVQLTMAQMALMEQETCFAFAPEGQSHDFGVPEGFTETIAALSPY